jgi:hypothetical protein
MSCLMVQMLSHLGATLSNGYKNRYYKSKEVTFINKLEIILVVRIVHLESLVF